MKYFLSIFFICICFCVKAQTKNDAMMMIDSNVLNLKPSGVTFNPNTRVIFDAAGSRNYYGRLPKRKPLIIVDGKRVNINKLKFINIDNIQSEKILKDKEAKDIYGKKGKNGVIIFTMKKKVEN